LRQCEFHLHPCKIIGGSVLNGVKAAKISPKHLSRRTVIRGEAARIFAEFGYDGSSLLQITEATGTPKSTIYHYYSSKEEILLDILSFSDSQVSPLMEREALADSDPLTKLERIVSVHVTWYLRHPFIAKVAFRDWKKLTGESLVMQTDRRRRHARFVKEQIECARDDGLLPASTNVSLVTNFINGAVSSANLWYDPDGRDTPEAIGKAFGLMAKNVVTLGLGDRLPILARKRGGIR
jgi:TetR/AcrR family transcriptional regulator, cholesterol catabolism regulator